MANNLDTLQPLKDNDIEDNGLGYFNNSFLKAGGIINRKNFLFLPNLFYSICIFSSVIIYLLSNKSESVFHFSLIALSIVYLIVFYICTSKRLTDVDGSKPKWYAVILFMLPLLCLYPLFAKGKISPNLNDKDNVTVQNSVFKIDGAISGKFFAINLFYILLISFIFYLLLGVDDKFINATFNSRDYGSISICILMMFIFNIAKYSNYKNAGL